MLTQYVPNHTRMDSYIEIMMYHLIQSQIELIYILTSVALVQSYQINDFHYIVLMKYVYLATLYLLL